MTSFLDARKVAAMLAALAEPTRLRIAFHLARGPHHVSQLAELLDTPMVNMSHHLGVMRQAGLLNDEKDGRRVVYSFRNEIITPGDGDQTLAILAIGTVKVVLKSDAQPRTDGKTRQKPRPKS
jgi:DNA-binding transcriptional ArsR family regulator